MAFSHWYWHWVVNKCNFTFQLISNDQEWQFHITTYILWSRLAISHGYWHIVVKFVRWSFFIRWTPQYQWRDALNTSTKNVPGEPTLADGPPTCMNGNFTLLLTSSGQEWQFHIATDIHWSGMGISHCYWHLVVKNSNFTLLLTSSGQEW